MNRRFSTWCVGWALTVGFGSACSDPGAQNPDTTATTASDIQGAEVSSPSDAFGALKAYEAPSTGYRAIFLDVGQGDATLLIAGTGETVLIDAGASPSLIIQRLVALDLPKLDAVVATHADADHIGGMAAVIKHFDVKKVYWNGLEKKTDIFKEFMAAAQEGTTTVAKRGDIWPLGGLTMEVLHPVSAAAESDHNDSSVVLLTGCAGAWLMLTGDAEAKAEAEMLKAAVLSDIDVLKVAHHGSSSGTTSAFLDAVTPEHAIISAGLNNKYGHPDASVVEALTTRDVVLHTTDTDWGDESVSLVSDCRGTYAITRLKQPL